MTEGTLIAPKIRPETSADFAAITEVNRLAIGGDVEAGLVVALREDGFLRLSLVAEVAGHILFSRLPIITVGGVVEAVSLAPMDEATFKKG